MEGARFTAHQELVARFSAPLKVMMQGKMKEAQDGVATLEDVDKTTFGPFVEWIYTGDFNPAKTATKAEVTAKEADIAESSHTEGFAFRSPRLRLGLPKAAPKTPTSSSVPVSNSLLQPFVQPPELHLPTASQFVHDNDNDVDHLPLFMSHTQLYVFSDTYGITELQQLSAHRLEEAMTAIELATAGLKLSAILPLRSTTNRGMAELIRYVYEHTADREIGKPDVLRTIVTICRKQRSCTSGISFVPHTPHGRRALPQ